MSTANMDGGDR